ncbi:MAG TPA: hypothetical protein VET23_09215 [Chitinophagaceae bacterium]|nr:hypothetical protein [Chitinophagaceae bacterium]
MKKILFFFLSTTPLLALSQAENEIQVYSSPITNKGVTFLELHSNYTFKGMDGLADPSSASYVNESLEITHGLGGNFEMGFYIFSAFVPKGGYQYLGSHIRPRITAPDKWKWPFGASLSVEFGFERPIADSAFVWDGEIRPIFDKSYGNWYFTFNPNMDFVLTGKDKHLGITPQFKTVYTIQQKVGIGIEYYSRFGTFKKILPGKMQEHLLGPMIDLYCIKNWEFNSGFLFGLTPNSNRTIFKLLLGRRFGK